MPTLNEVTAYCDKRTRRAAFKDYPGALNGLQVANDGRVTRIGAAVDAGLVPFEKAVERGVDFLIVHHGLFWGGVQPLTGPVYGRFAALVRGNCAVYSSHLPLDAHEEIGNNVLLARQLGLEAETPLPLPRGRAGRLDRTQQTQALAALRPARGTLPTGGRDRLRLGDAEAGRVLQRQRQQRRAAAARAAGVDTLITGELREEWFNYAQEHHLNLICCGHYATEVHGVKALAAELAKKFRLPWEFIETDNPL